MRAAWKPIDAFEDLLARVGIPTRCLEVESSTIAKSIVQIVFPQNRELDLSDALDHLATNERAAMERLFPTGVETIFRTILYHLSRDIFSTIYEQGGPFVSTNVPNLHEPEQETFADGRVRLAYNVDLILVYQDVPSYDRASAERLARSLCVQFNRASRFLTVRHLRIGHTPYRALLPGQKRPELQTVSLE